MLSLVLKRYSWSEFIRLRVLNRSNMKRARLDSAATQGKYTATMENE